jgi:outer membrane protein, multidrug efflux system
MREAFGARGIPALSHTQSGGMRRTPNASRVRLAPVNLAPRLMRFRFGLRTSVFRRPSGFGLRVSRFFNHSSFVIWLFLALLAGCAVGPNYHRPAALGTNAVPPAYAEGMPTNTSIWKPAHPSAHLPKGSWWEVLGDPELNRLEVLATDNNQQLAAAYANLQQARAQVGVARADFWPQLSATPEALRQRISANQSSGAASSSKGQTFTTLSVPLDATWEIDLWGRVRRAVESTKATLAASADDLESSKLSIQAEVATDYITLVSLDAQVRVLEETCVAYRRSLELTQNRRKGGIATDLDVSQAETILTGTEAQIPAVKLLRATTLHALATLCGRDAISFTVNAPTNIALVAPGVPLGIPSELLERRPDVSAAERRVTAANAQIGVATAAFFPTITINGLAGLASIDAGKVFNWESRVWSLGPSLSWPMFTGGRNKAQLQFARAGYDATVANYRQTVLSAFQDVEDQLVSQYLLQEQYEKESAALKSARRSVEISLTKYKGGVITYLDVVIAQTAELTHEQQVVQLEGQRLAAVVALIKALGAGWTAPPDSEVTTTQVRSKSS